MKRIATLLAAVLLLCGVVRGQDSQRQRLEKHLYTLASDSLRGREAGTPDGQKAADYILRQWRQMGLTPFWGDNYQVPFRQDNPILGQGNFCNLVAVIEGNDPELKDEYIVLGAHYDHIGMKGDRVCNGADDNASGSSCLLEITRQLVARRGDLKRSVIICAFDAEEKGLFGSKAIVRQLKDKGMIDQVKLMLSIDMVGWYQANGELVLDGSGTVDKAKGWLAPAPLGSDIKVRFKPFENSLFTATDTEPFAEEGIPTLAVTTGLKSPYHKPEDDADLIDYDGLDRITDYLTALTVAASRHDGKLASGRLASKHKANSFEAGLAVGYNTSNLDFPDAVIVGKSHCGFQGGLMLHYNLGKFFALHADVLYNYSNCPLPAPDDAYGKGFGMEQHSVFVPVTLQLGFREMGTGFFIGFGGYYGRVLDGRFYGDLTAASPHYQANPDQGGLIFDFGMRLGGHWRLAGTWYYHKNNLFSTAPDLPRARMDSYAVTLGYYF